MSFTLCFGKRVICLGNGKISDESISLPERGPLYQGHTVVKMFSSITAHFHYDL